jgi:uncharacterized protein
MAGKFVIELAKNGKLKFNLKAGNSQVILTSELYDAKASAKAGIESVRKNTGDDARFIRKIARNGSRFFVLTATNKEVIGTSEMYKSAASMERGIASVWANAPKAKVVDRT